MKKIVASHGEYLSKENQEVLENTVYVFKDNDKVVTGFSEIETKVFKLKEFEIEGEVKKVRDLVSLKRMIFIGIGESLIEVLISRSPVVTYGQLKEGDEENKKSLGFIDQFMISRKVPFIEGGEKSEKIINEIKTNIGL